MTVLVLGCDGQLGTELLKQFPAATGLSRSQLDISDGAAVKAALLALQPAWVINCAAYTQVDLAENEPLLAFQGNALGPRELARSCREHAARLVHISTDYVFGGEDLPPRARTENDCPVPVSVYGNTKLAGEHFVLSELEQCLVLRTCGLYGSGGKGNFVRTMLKLACAGRALKVVDDQICSPTSVKDLVRAIAVLMEQQATGLFHVVNEGAVSWYQFAQMIFEKAGLSVDLTPISSCDYAALAKRPAYSVMSCEKYQQLTGRTLPSLEAALQEFLDENFVRQST